MDEKIQILEERIELVRQQIHNATRRHRWRRVKKLQDKLLYLLFVKYTLTGIFPSKYQKHIGELPTGIPGPACKNGPLAPADKSTQILPNGKVVNIKWKILQEEVKVTEEKALQKISCIIGNDCQSLLREKHGVVGVTIANGDKNVRICELPVETRAQVTEILEYYSSANEGGVNMLPKNF